MPRARDPIALEDSSLAKQPRVQATMLCVQATSLDEEISEEAADIGDEYREQMENEELLEVNGDDDGWEKDDDQWDETLQAEGEQLEQDRMDEFDSYEAVPRTDARGHRVVSTRWVYRKKRDEHGNRIIRARFVARELKVHDPHRTDLFAPSSMSSTGRVVDSHIAKEDTWSCTADVSNAFLHTPLEDGERVFVEPPAAWRAKQKDQNVIWR